MGIMKSIKFRDKKNVQMSPIDVWLYEALVKKIWSITNAGAPSGLSRTRGKV